MDANLCQRWREHRSFYRPAGELFDPRSAAVEPIDEQSAKRFVLAHHYAGSYPAARFRAGLFVRRPFAAAELAGVAVFSVPMSQHIVPRYFAGLAPNSGVELGRLVLLDDVAANAESWFVARAFKLVRAALGVDGIVSYSDPIVRTSLAGEQVKPGHVGTVYQALNARYRGRGTPARLLVDDAGRVVSPRALSKLRNDESGAGYAYKQLRAAGAPEREPFESGADYATRVAAGFRSLRHPGNHVYTWWLGDKRQAPPVAALAYPKLQEAA